MKKLIVLMICVAGWTLVPSCTQKHPEKIKQLDAMLQDLDKAQKHVDSIDLELVSELYKASDKQIRFLQKNYVNDTINRETAMMLGDFRSSYKSLKKLKDLHGKLNHEIDFTRNQITKLKTDIASNQLTEDQIVDYILSEGKAIAFINEKSPGLYHWQQRAIRNNRGIKPIIDSIVFEMNQNGIR